MKKPEYINSQIIPYGCGPIALMNVYRSLGFTAPVQFFMEAFESWGFRHKSGVGQKFIRTALSEVGINSFEIEKPTVETIERFLDLGCTVLVSYVWEMPVHRPIKQFGGHVVFIDSHEGAFFNAYNVNGNGAEKKEVMARYLAGGDAIAWVIDGVDWKIERVDP